MAGHSGAETVSTRQQRIAELAQQAPQMGFTSLNHHLDLTWLLVAYWSTRRDGAVGRGRDNRCGLRSGPDGQSAFAAGPGQVRLLPGTAGAAGAYPERTRVC